MRQTHWWQLGLFGGFVSPSPRPSKWLGQSNTHPTLPIPLLGCSTLTTSTHSQLTNAKNNSSKSSSLCICRRSSSVPQTRIFPFDMIATRSHSFSTSRMM